MSNPDLISAQNQGQRVSEISRFRHLNESGEMVQSHRAMPTVLVTPKFYYCSLPTASLHRPDGTRIPFVFGFYETNVEATQLYLDNEISYGNPYISEATPDQIEFFKMKRDPRGTMRDQLLKELTPQLEAETRDRLENQIREQILATLAESMPPELTDEQRISGIDEMRRKLEIARRSKEPVQVETGNAVVTQTGPLMESKAAPLQGIVSTDSINAAASGSVAAAGGLASLKAGGTPSSAAKK